MGTQHAIAPPPDALVAAAQRGDTQAREDLAARLRPGLVRLVAGQMGAAARRWIDPEDVAQRALAEVLADLAALPDADVARHLVARLVRTARWRLVDAVRRHEREAGESVLGAVGLDGPEDQPSSGPVTRADTRRWLEALVARLPPDYAEVVRLRGLEGLDVATTARRLGVSPAVVRQRWSRARRRLAERLAARRPPPPAAAGPDHG